MRAFNLLWTYRSAPIDCRIRMFNDLFGKNACCMVKSQRLRCARNHHYTFKRETMSDLNPVCQPTRTPSWLLLLRGSCRFQTSALCLSRGSISSVCRLTKPLSTCPPVLREQERYIWPSQKVCWRGNGPCSSCQPRR